MSRYIRDSWSRHLTRCPAQMNTRHPLLSWQRNSYREHRISGSHLYSCSPSDRNQMPEPDSQGPEVQPCSPLCWVRACILPKLSSPQRSLPWCQGKPDPGFLTERLNHPRWAETTVHMTEVTSIKFFVVKKNTKKETNSPLLELPSLPHPVMLRILLSLLWFQKESLYRRAQVWTSLLEDLLFQVSWNYLYLGRA